MMLACPMRYAVPRQDLSVNLSRYPPLRKAASFCRIRASHRLAGVRAPAFGRTLGPELNDRVRIVKSDRIFRAGRRLGARRGNI
jgi:hypothetical protein